MNEPRVRRFFSELKRRRVYNVAVAYVVVGLGVLGAAELMLEPLGLYALMPFIVVITILGFPLAMVLAWAYELHPEDSAPEADAADDGTKSIIVLPFDNISPDPSDAYLADGLTDEITTHLSQLGSFRVISRSSAMALKGTHKSIRAIAAELGVRFALEGSVRKVGETLRITAQLIDARVDQNLWGNRYEGTLDDVFQFQEQASRAIVKALDVNINPGAARRPTALPAENREGYEAYLRARHELNLGTPDSLKAGLRHMKAALDAVGPNELILQGMAEAYIFLAEYSIDRETQPLRHAEEFMARLEQISPESAATYYLRGKIERVKGDHVSVFRNSRRAVELDPNNASALINMVSSASLQLGRPDWVASQVDPMIELDPFNPLALLVAGHQRLVSRQFDEALDFFQRAVALEPDFIHAHVVGTAFVHSWQGRPERAMEDLEPIARSASSEPLAEFARLILFVLRGDRDRAAGALPQSVIPVIASDPEAPYFLGSIYALAGIDEEALNWLERAVKRGWMNYPLFTEVDPHFAGLRDNPRFQELVARVKASWEEVGRELR